MEFHNNSVSLNDLFYASHKNLIMNLCIEFGASDRITELTEKFLGKKMKMKPMKDHAHFNVDTGTLELSSRYKDIKQNIKHRNKIAYSSNRIKQ